MLTDQNPYSRQAYFDRMAERHRREIERENREDDIHEIYEAGLARKEEI